MHIKLAILLVCGVCARARADALHDLVHLYEAESRAMREAGATPETARGFWSTWRDRLVTGVQAMPQSDSAEAAMTKIVGLSHGLGDYEAAMLFATRLRDIQQDPYGRADWAAEIGEIAHEKYLATRSAADAAKAVEYLEQAATEAVAGFRDRGGDRQVIIESLLGRLHRDSGGSPAKAVLHLERAYQVFEDRKLSGVGRLSGTFDRESLGSDLMDAAVEAHQIEKAREYLYKALTGDHQRLPPSVYAIRFANMALAQDPAALQQFCREWLARIKTDSHTPVLRLILADSLYGQQSFLEAIPIYTALFRDYEASLKSHEAGNGSQLLGTLLFNLSQAWWRVGDSTKALDLLETFKRMCPDDPRIRALAKTFQQIDSDAFAEFPHAEMRVDRVAKTSSPPALVSHPAAGVNELRTDVPTVRWGTTALLIASAAGIWGAAVFVRRWWMKQP